MEQARQEPTPTALRGDPELGRLLWRCRRGMKELDVVLDRYARQALPSATREERLVFARLLELPDPELADYLLGPAIPSEPDLADLARRIVGRDE